MALLGKNYLKIYLEDHYAGSTVALELARRAAEQNAGSAYGDELARLAAEIADDRRAFEEIMTVVGVEPNRIKAAGAWLGEKAGRLKLNGHLTSYSPQSRVIELEGIQLAVVAKLLLWRALRDVRELVPELPSARLEELAARAEGQRDRLEELRLEAVREAVSAAERG